MIPTDFQVTLSNVKVKLLVIEKKGVHPMSLDPFAGKLPNLVQWILLESTVGDSYGCSDHVLQGQGQTAGINVCSISFDSFT